MTPADAINAQKKTSNFRASPPPSRNQTKTVILNFNTALAQRLCSIALLYLHFIYSSASMSCMYAFIILPQTPAHSFTDIYMRRGRLVTRLRQLSLMVNTILLSPVPNALQTSFIPRIYDETRLSFPLIRIFNRSRLDQDLLCTRLPPP